jgi:hypothetical protein
MNIFVGPKPDRQQIQALNRCKLPENEALVRLLQVKLEETKNSLMLAEELVKLYRLQGRAEALADFLEAVEKSSEILERVK